MLDRRTKALASGPLEEMKMADNTDLWLPSALGRRRFLGVAGGAAVAALLAACGSDNGRSGGDTTTSSSTAAPPTSSADTGSGSGGSSSVASGSGSAPSSATGTGGPKPELAQWYHAYGEDGTKAAVERYAAGYPDATVKVSWFPGDYDSKIATALGTGEAPDVFEAGNGPSIDAIQAGQVADLSDLLDATAKSDFSASLLERMSFDGKLYAIPQVIDMQLLVYRKSALDKASVKPPTTIDELLVAAKALTTGKQKGLFVGNDGGVGTLIGPTLWSIGEDYLTADNKVGFTPEKAGPALAKLHALFTSGNLLLGAPADWSAPDSFTNGLTAMQWTGLWTLPDIIKAVGDDFGVLPWPSDAGGKPSAPIGAYGSAVSAKSKNVDAAKAFVKWLWVDNADDQLDFAQSYGFHVPARASVAAKADKLKSGPALDAAKIVQDNGHAQTPLLWSPASSTAMTDAATNIIKSGADPVAELSKVVTKVQSELARILK